MKKNNNDKFSLGVSEFNTLIEEEKIYVDKTKFIKKMIDDGRIYYFLSRPRRFGKTLLVSTLENLFEGKKELFKGLYIYDKWDFSEKYPVIRISMTDLANSSPEKLEDDILSKIKSIALMHNIRLEEGSYVSKFSQLIYKLYESKNKVVVLIDEYDAPILDNISNSKLSKDNSVILQNFYKILKTSEKYIKFVFITGISKFTKVSIFSTFNNLTEITLNKEYSTICGITHNELEYYYREAIQEMANENNYSYKKTLNEINFWYDGYSWDGENRVFNPYSTLKAFFEKKFSSFWYGTGTPSFLAEIFKIRQISTDYFKSTLIKETELDAIDPLNINESTLLFQSGYLTVDKELIKERIIHYLLKIPNFEVETAFQDNLLELYKEKVEIKVKKSEKRIWEELINGNCEKISKRLRAYIAGLPYYIRLSKENTEKWKFYSLIFTTWAKTMNFEIIEEKTIEDGRIDFVLENIEKEQIIIVEMKYSENQNKTLDNLTSEAFKQIEKKRYWYAYEDNVKLMALALKDIYIDDGFITDVKCKIKEIPE